MIFCVLLRACSCGSYALKNIASQQYVDGSIKSNMTKCRQLDDLSYGGNDTLVLSSEVVGIVSGSNAFVSTADFRDNVTAAVGDALADDRDLKKSVEKMVTDVVNGMDNVVDETQLNSTIEALGSVYVRQEKVIDAEYDADKHDASNIYSAFYVQRAFAPSHDHPYIPTARIGSISSGEDKDDIASSDYSIPTARTVSSMISSSDHVTSTALSSTLSGYVKSESIAAYDKDKSPGRDEIYSAASLHAAIGALQDIRHDYIASDASQPAPADKAWSATVSDELYARRPAAGTTYITSDAIDASDNDEEGMKVPSSVRAGEIAAAKAAEWFDSAYFVVE